MHLKQAESEELLDQNLKPWCFLNESHQTAVWVSYLNTGIPGKMGQAGVAAPYPLNLFPHMWERHPRIISKPGKICALPHRYYFVTTRDDSPVKGREMGMDETLEEYADATLSTDVFSKAKGKL